MVSAAAFSCCLFTNNGEASCSELCWVDYCSRAGLFAATAACPGAAAGAAPGGDGDDAGSFYVNPMAEYSLMDDKRPVGDAFGFQAGLGVNVASHAALELNYGDIRSKLQGYPVIRRRAKGSRRFRSMRCSSFFPRLRRSALTSSSAPVRWTIRPRRTPPPIKPGWRKAVSDYWQPSVRKPAGRASIFVPKRNIGGNSSRTRLSSPTIPATFCSSRVSAQFRQSHAAPGRCGTSTAPTALSSAATPAAEA